MRVGKRANVVEAKRTRSCVVRLENISSPPFKGIKATRNSGGSTRSHADVKNYKGPLKNRPSAQGQNATPNTSQTRSRPVSTPNSTQSAKSKSNTSNAAQTSSKSGTPNSAQANKSKSGTPNSAQTAKSKSGGNPNAAQTSSKDVAPKSMQASASKSRPAAKDAFKTPLKAAKGGEQRKSIVTTPAPTEHTPTVASGRSRRAIKPNPKYASEDILTPKMIRNVATVSGGTGGSTTTKKPTTTTSTKKRKVSISSLDDFFSQESNEEMDDDDLEDELDKMYRAIAKDSDSDFSDSSQIAKPRVLKRAKPKQPRQNIYNAPTANTAATPLRQTQRPMPSSAHKAQPTQLQLLRKSFAASVNRSIEPRAGVKRGHNDSVTVASGSDNDEDLSGIARKRPLLTKPLTPKVASSRDNKNSNSSEVSLQIRKTTQQTLNGSKINKLKIDSGVASTVEPKANLPTRVIEKRKLMDGNSVTMKMMQQSRFQQQTVRSNSNNNSNTTATKSTTATSTATSKTRTLITMPTKTQNVRGLSLTKRRSASPAITKPSPKAITKPTPSSNASKEDKATNEKVVDNKPIETEALTTAVEDFETMPTFTIVNINDIINKKGDVLISKSDKSQKDDSDMSDDYELPEIKKPVEHKPVVPERRKVILPTKKASGEVRGSKSPITTATTTKKLPTQKVLNHTLVTKKSSPTTSTNASTNRNKLNSSISPPKPAPRILNSVVAKKTQPVKPMIANFDDSENENTYQLSLDGDEDMGSDDDEDTQDKTVAPDVNEDISYDDDEQDDSFYLGKSRLPTSTPYTAKKKAAPPPPSTTSPSKENSQTAPNRQLITTKNIEQRKTTPEKVVISRQGDKVIKKITCFETWYVIMPDEVKPNKLPTPRNILDIPLIKLANIARDIKLPNGDWKGKVTLNELSPAMLAKTNLTLFTGDLKEYNIAESDRARYQPSCVMFRRTVNDRSKSRLPYDRAVIFKNRTFFTNIEGKNVKLAGAPTTINTQKEVEILLQIIDSLTLQSTFVEPTNTMQ